MMTREQVVVEARSWIGTPYRRGARIKGVGIDCATLLLEVFRTAGIVIEGKLDFFSDDWFANTNQEEYMTRVVRHAYKVVEQFSYVSQKVQPGNMILVRAARSKVYNHGAIVTAWPKIVHAVRPDVIETDISRNPLWTHQQIAVFDPWATPPEGTI